MTKNSDNQDKKRIAQLKKLLTSNKLDKVSVLKNNLGQPLLHALIDSANPEILDILLHALQRCPSGRSERLLTATDTQGNTLLHYIAVAACGCTTSMVYVLILANLIKLGADLLAKNSDGKTPLELYQPYQQGPYYKLDTLVEKIKTGKILSIKRALDKRLPFDTRYQGGNTLLHVSVHEHQWEIAQLIAARCPELLTLRNFLGKTALELAADAEQPLSALCADEQVAGPVDPYSVAAVDQEQISKLAALIEENFNQKKIKLLKPYLATIWNLALSFCQESLALLREVKQEYQSTTSASASASEFFPSSRSREYARKLLSCLFGESLDPAKLDIINSLEKNIHSIIFFLNDIKINNKIEEVVKLTDYEKVDDVDHGYVLFKENKPSYYKKIYIKLGIEPIARVLAVLSNATERGTKINISKGWLNTQILSFVKTIIHEASHIACISEDFSYNACFSFNSGYYESLDELSNLLKYGCDETYFKIEKVTVPHFLIAITHELLAGKITYDDINSKICPTLRLIKSLSEKINEARNQSKVSMIQKEMKENLASIGKFIGRLLATKNAQTLTLAICGLSQISRNKVLFRESALPKVIKDNFSSSASKAVEEACAMFDCPHVTFLCQNQDFIAYGAARAATNNLANSMVSMYSSDQGSSVKCSGAPVMSDVIGKIGIASALTHQTYL